MKFLTFLAISVAVLLTTTEKASAASYQSSCIGDCWVTFFEGLDSCRESYTDGVLECDYDYFDDLENLKPFAPRECKVKFGPELRDCIMSYCPNNGHYRDLCDAYDDVTAQNNECKIREVTKFDDCLDVNRENLNQCKQACLDNSGPANVSIR